MRHTTTDDTEPPVACSLTPADYSRRAAATRELAREALLSRRPLEGGVRLTFADVADARRRLAVFAAAEATCCPFLDMRLSAADGEVVLDITGPPDAAPIIAEMFA